MLCLVPRIRVWRNIDSTLKAPVYNLFLATAQGGPCVIFIQYATDSDQQVWGKCLRWTRNGSHRERFSAKGCQEMYVVLIHVQGQLLHNSFWRALSSPWRYMIFLPLKISERLWQISNIFIKSKSWCLNKHRTVGGQGKTLAWGPVNMF